LLVNRFFLVSVDHLVNQLVTLPFQESSFHALFRIIKYIYGFVLLLFLPTLHYIWGSICIVFLDRALFKSGCLMIFLHRNLIGITNLFRKCLFCSILIIHIKYLFFSGQSCLSLFTSIPPPRTESTRCRVHLRCSNYRVFSFPLELLTTFIKWYFPATKSLLVQLITICFQKYFLELFNIFTTIVTRLLLLDVFQCFLFALIAGLCLKCWLRN